MSPETFQPQPVMAELEATLAERWAPADEAVSRPGRFEGLSPAEFSEGPLGHRLWEGQRRMLEVMDVPRAQVAIKSCNSAGKSFAMADLVLWWLVVQGGKIIITGPKWQQVKDQLWAECRQTIRQAGLGLPDPLQAGLEIGPHCWARAMATNAAMNLEGYHGKVLFVVDEAPGVPAALFKPIEGARSGADVRVAQLGNPLAIEGGFYEAFGPHRAAWTTLSVSAFETPNLVRLLDGLDPEVAEDEELIARLRAVPEEVLHDNPWPMLCSPAWVLEMVDKYGVDHWEVQARVFARFPRQLQSAIVPLDWLERAERDQEGGNTLEAGVDVAGAGESETVVYVRAGPQIVELWASAEADAWDHVPAILRPYRDRLRVVKVDTVGVGFGLGRELEDDGYRVVGVQVGDPPRGATPEDQAEAKELYANLKAQLYWTLRERFRDRLVGGLTDADTVQQLQGMRWGRRRGRIQIEGKKDMKARGLPSPDRAEALMLAFAPLELARTEEPPVRLVW